MKAECPKCKSTNLDISDTDGDVLEGTMVFKCYCMDCNCGFELNCNIEVSSIKVSDWGK